MAENRYECEPDQRRSADNDTDRNSGKPGDDARNDDFPRRHIKGVEKHATILQHRQDY